MESRRTAIGLLATGSLTTFACHYHVKGFCGWRIRWSKAGKVLLRRLSAVRTSLLGTTFQRYTKSTHVGKFARQVDSGNIHINRSPMWRADLMPYGGLKESGMGKEGPKYAIEEMTEMKTVVIHS